MENYNICEQCSKKQKTCCQDSDIFLTLGDIDRINELGIQNFYEKRQAGESYLEFTNTTKDKLWKITIDKDNNRRVTKKIDGHCMFLVEDRCCLDMEIKPLVCRIYPYDFNPKCIFIGYSACPVELVGANAPMRLGMKIKDAERWRKMLYKELHIEAMLEKVIL